MPDALYNYARHIRGEAHERRVPGTPAQEIKAGDFLVLQTGTAQRASTMPDVGLLAANQAAAKAVFLGVAIDQKRAGETRDVLVASRGVFRFPCVALVAASNVGAFVGIAGTVGAVDTFLENQMVVIVASQAGAIGKLARAAAIGDVFLEVEISGVLTTVYSGAQAAV